MLFEKIKLEDDEQVLLLVRRHWFVFLLRVVGVVGMMFVPLIALFAATLSPITANMVTSALTNYSDQIYFAVALWLLVGWVSLALLWTDQYLDLWVVTNRRIISIDQRHLFVRSIGSFRLERLQDINIEIPGFLATMFDFGNVEAETASGSDDEFHVFNLPRPREIKSIILEAADLRMKTANVAQETL